jgi:alpha-glucosidase
MADFGYDVADYCGIDPRFGTLADFDSLLKAAHDRGLKLLLDFVPNHSPANIPGSSRAARRAIIPKRDWYIWRDPAPDGGPPNNWISDFGGPAWEWDEGTGQYYYHAFLKEQPDLNWRNPELRRAMLDVLRFWFDRGVDGFRIDVLWHMIKHQDFPDNPANPAYTPGLAEMHRCSSSTRPTSPKSTVSPPRCAASRTPIPNACWSARSTCRSKIDALLWRRRTGRAPALQLPADRAPWEACSLARLIAEYEAALPRAAGRIGCSATTIGRAQPRGSAKRKPASRRCCC